MSTFEYGVTDYRNVNFALPLALEERIRSGRGKVNLSAEIRRLLDQALTAQGR